MRRLKGDYWGSQGEGCRLGERVGWERGNQGEGEEGRELAWEIGCQGEG